MKEVHGHYTCHCLPWAHVGLNLRDPIVEIDIERRCRLCSKGRLRELIIGTVSLSVTECPNCGYSCDRFHVKLPLDQFIAYVGPLAK
jgi:hypothetical protein